MSNRDTEDELAKYLDVWKQRLPALEAVLGPAEKSIKTAMPPIYLGGGADILTFRDYVDGVTYVTSGLTGEVDGVEQVPSTRIGNYELMICLPKEADWAANLISLLARYTMDAELNPGETMDLPNGQIHELDGSKITTMLFAEPDLKSKTFEFGGHRFGLLLCMGITSTEFKAMERNGSAILIQALKRAGMFPFFDVDRASLSEADLEADPAQGD